MSNRWRIICFSSHIHLSLVGFNLNQMFLRLIRISSVLQYMRILSDQSSYLTVRETKSSKKNKFELFLVVF